MSLMLRNLDDRRWADLVDEARALIPVHARRWTDHNIHDPGITFLELLAWIAEGDIYRVNRIPDAHKRRFLAVVGIRPKPPRPARGVLAVRLASGSGPILLPEGAELAAEAPDGGPVAFRTTEPLTAVPGRIAAVLRSGGEALVDLTEAWRRGEMLRPFGPDPRLGAAFYLGLDLPDGPPADAPVTLAFRTADARESERTRLREAERRARGACRSGLPDPCAPPEEPSSEDDEEHILRHHDVRLIWEVPVGGTWYTLAEEDVVDDTRAFTLDGRVTIKLPVGLTPQVLPEVGRPLFSLRVRLAGGAYDKAPELRAFDLNGVAVEQARDVEAEEIGVGTGLPWQRYALSAPAVAEDSLALTTNEPDGVVRWQARPDFLASGRGDAHFVLDPDAGILAFGDGERGRVPPESAPILATYRSTLGSAGNLPALPPPTLAGVQGFGWLATPSGGAMAETVDDAIARALERVEENARAVTLADYEALALATPGTRIARAIARANAHPAFPCLAAPGVVTVTIVPFLPAGRPMPSPGLRRLVRAQLAGRRLIGTRVVVAAPTYVEVMVEAKVRACPGVSRPALAARVAAALDAFFDPLAGGPGGDGWPLGRDVYRAEVLTVVDETEGADHVLDLVLVDRSGTASCGNLCVPPNGLVTSGPHRIEVV